MLVLRVIEMKLYALFEQVFKSFKGRYTFFSRRIHMTKDNLQTI